MAAERPRRDHRPDERARLGDRPGQRRPRWRLLDVHRLVRPAGGRRLRERDGAGGLRRAAAGRRVVHRRPLVEPTLIGLAYAFEQATKVQRPAAVHPVDRCRVLSGAPAPVAREGEGVHPGPQQQLEVAPAVTRLRRPRTHPAGAQSPRRDRSCLGVWRTRPVVRLRGLLAQRSPDQLEPGELAEILGAQSAIAGSRCRRGRS